MILKRFYCLLISGGLFLLVLCTISLPQSMAKDKKDIKGNKLSTYTQEDKELTRIKSESDAALLEDRLKLKRARSMDNPYLKKHLKISPPQKLKLFPLPDKGKEVQLDCPRCKGIEELKQRIQDEENTQIKERDLLLLAGKYVGQDDWESAQRIYKELETKSKDPGVIEAVRRNLEVVNLKLAILSEKDPLQKEILELDLADLHRELGHYQASKRIYRRLAKEAENPQIRSKAKESLITKTGPDRPPLPINHQQLKKLNTQSILPEKTNDQKSEKEGAL